MQRCSTSHHWHRRRRDATTTTRSTVSTNAAASARSRSPSCRHCRRRPLHANAHGAYPRAIAPHPRPAQLSVFGAGGGAAMASATAPRSTWAEHVVAVPVHSVGQIGVTAAHTPTSLAGQSPGPVRTADRSDQRGPVPCGSQELHLRSGVTPRAQAAPPPTTRQISCCIARPRQAGEGQWGGRGRGELGNWGWESSSWPRPPGWGPRAQHTPPGWRLARPLSCQGVRTGLRGQVSFVGEGGYNWCLRRWSRGHAGGVDGGL